MPQPWSVTESTTQFPSQLRADQDLAPVRGGFPGVENEIDEDLLDLFGIDQHRRDAPRSVARDWSPAPSRVARVAVTSSFKSHSLFAPDSSFLLQKRHAAGHRPDLFHALGDDAHGVFAEFRVFIMDRQVFQGQGKGRGDVLEVMHEKGGKGLKGLHFFRPAEAFEEPVVEQHAGGLLADGFQEVEILVGKRLPAWAIVQGHHAEEFPAYRQGGAVADGYIANGWRF